MSRKPKRLPNGSRSRKCSRRSAKSRRYGAAPPSRSSSARTMPRRKADAAAVVFALLVVATVAAFAYAQRVKRDPQIIDRFGPKSKTFTPKGECHRRLKFKFRTTTTNDHGTVEII